jgi:hypothetical protein
VIDATREGGDDGMRLGAGTCSDNHRSR